MTNLPNPNDFSTINVKILDMLDTTITLQEVEETLIYGKKCSLIEYTTMDSDQPYTSYIMDRQLRKFLNALNEGNHIPLDIIFTKDVKQNNRLTVQYPSTDT